MKFPCKIFGDTNNIVNKLYVLLIAIILCATSGCESASDFRILKTKMIKNSDDIHVHSMIIDKNNNIILAGTELAGVQGPITLSRYISKINQDGNIVWSRKYSDFSFYNDIAAINNDSYYTCGMPDYKITATQAKPSRIEKFNLSGDIYFEKNIAPKNSNTQFSSELNKCIKWNDGLIAIGSAQEKNKMIYLWINFIDASGNKIWEQLIPSPISDFHMESSAIISSTDNSLLVAKHIYVNNNYHIFNTELIKLDKDGAVLNRNIFQGAWYLVKPTNGNKTDQLIGGNLYGSGYYSIKNIDKNLNVINEISTNMSMKRWHGNIAYGDGDTVKFFGSQEQLFGGNIGFVAIIDKKGNAKLIGINSLGTYKISAAYPSNDSNIYIAIGECINTDNTPYKTALYWIKFK